MSVGGTSARGSIVCRYRANPRTTISRRCHVAGLMSLGVAHASASSIVIVSAPWASR